jgi:hypothetical protein
MAFTPSNLAETDREFHKFVGAVGTGSETSVNVTISSGNITIGSVSAHVDSIYVQSGTLYVASGNVAVSGTPYDPYLELARTNTPNQTFVHKFGATPDFDTGDGKVTVWDGADDGGIDEMTYNYSTTADIDSLISSNAGDGQVVEIQGLDATGELKIQGATLNGQNRVEISTPLIRAFRLKNSGTTNFAGDVCLYVSGEVTTGVPDDTSLIRACVSGANNQTLMAVYTIPSDRKGYMQSWYASTAGASRTTNFIVDILARPSGGVFQLKHRSAIVEEGNSHIQHIFEVPEKFDPFTDIEVRTQTTEAAITAATVSAGFDIILISGTT